MQQDVSGSWFSSAIFSFVVFWLIYLTKAPVNYELFYETNMLYLFAVTGLSFLISIATILLAPNEELKDTRYIFAMASVIVAIAGWSIISETSKWVYDNFSNYANVPWVMALVSALYQYVIAFVVLIIVLIIAAIVYKFGASK